MRVDLGPVGIRHQPLSLQAAGNMLALELRRELAQIHPDQIGRQAIDRRLKCIMPVPAAADFRLVIAGEQAVAPPSR